MQQRILQLEQMINQQQQQQFNEVFQELIETLSPLHSLEVRPTYNWQPIPFLEEILNLDKNLFTSNMLSYDQRRQIIEKYPAIEYLQYQPPDTIPIAAKCMKKQQSKYDMSLKRLQYILSGIIRPLDVQGLEVSKDEQNVNAHRHLHILADCRRLILNLSSQMTEMRNNIVFQAINPTFSSNTNNNKSYFLKKKKIIYGLANHISYFYIRCLIKFYKNLFTIEFVY